MDTENNVIKSVYNILESAKETTIEVKRYSKLKITLFCIEQGIWEQVKEFLTGIGYYDLFVMAQFFLETDEYFTKGLQMYAESLIDEDTTEEDVNDLIETMKNFAHDGFVTMDDDGTIVSLNN